MLLEGYPSSLRFTFTRFFARVLGLFLPEAQEEDGTHDSSLVKSPVCSLLSSRTFPASKLSGLVSWKVGFCLGTRSWGKMVPLYLVSVRGE